MRIGMVRRLIQQSRWLLAVMVLFLVGAGRAHAQCSGVPSSTTGVVTWNPQWCQEFNATTPGPPDTTVWAFDTGNSGFGNHEVETYCGPPGYMGNLSTCPSTFSAGTSNAYIDGAGHLVVQALSNDGGTTWTSGRMKTQGLQDFQYGRIEASMMLPDTTNQGLWPSIWSLGSDISTTPWPACGEADIMEVWSKAVLGGPGPTGNRSTIHTTVTGGSGLQPNGAFTFPAGTSNSTAFHTYGMIWSANMQQYYIDNPLQPYYITTASNLPSGDTWPFNAKIFLLTNIAVGGTLGGTPSASTPNPAIMMLDYVRQYTAATVTPPLLGTPPSINVKAGATSGNTSVFSPTLATGTGYVYFSCSTTAPKASCGISTTDPLNKFVVNSAAAETVTVTVTTTANSSEAKLITPRTRTPQIRAWLPIAVAGFLLSIVVIPGGRVRSRTSLICCALAAGLVLTGSMAGCGGGSNTTTTTPTPPSNNGTTAGSYTVNVFAFTESNVSDGTNAKADATVSIPLTVN